MQITFKLYAALSDYLPTDARDNRIALEVDEHTSPYAVIDKYQVPREQAHLVLLNGVYLSTAQRQQPVFKHGDVLAVWPPVAGG